MYFNGPITTEPYTEILSGPLVVFLKDEVSLRNLSRMWYEHDGAPVHKSAQPYTFLAQSINTRIIGYKGEQEWPPRSPDLYLLDFYLWGFLKRKVYERESTSKTDLLNRINIACL